MVSEEIFEVGGGKFVAAGRCARGRSRRIRRPATSLASGLAEDFNAASNVFVRLRWIHPVLAMVCGGWLLSFGMGALRSATTRKAAGVMLGMLGAQILAGAVNLLLLAPVWMQIVHLLLGDLLWISLVLLCARMLAEEKAGKSELHR